MKLPHRYIIGLIGLLIGFILIFILWRRNEREGFQATVPFTTLNIDYPIKEVFLVGDVGGTSAPNYDNAYTYQEAAGVCQKYGATLATMAQLQNMFCSLGHWCTGGWVQNKPNNLYYPSSGGGMGLKCANTGTTAVTSEIACTDSSSMPSGTSIKQMALPASKKGFPLCYGVKPVEGSSGNNIMWFSPTAYSITETDTVSQVESDPYDLFPVKYTTQVAYYALEQKNFDSSTARKFLNDNYKKNDTEVRKLAAPAIAPITGDTDVTVGWQAQRSCDILNNIQTEYKSKVTTLNGIFQQIKSKTDAMYWSKEEAMNLQNQIINVCQNYTPDTSPACKALALIDYTVFYGDENTTKILNTLESLNISLITYQCELQNIFKHLQVIMDLLKCSYDSTTATTLGSYKKSDGSYFSCGDMEGTGENDPRPFSAGKSIGYNSEQSIIKALQGISPLFALSENTSYRDNPAFEELLNGLSSILDLPTLNDYSSSIQNFSAISSQIGRLATSLATKFAR